MTATEILRRLLDEHGVEHKDFFDQTWWEDSDGAAYTAVETRPLYNNNPSTKLMLKRTATPEQAIVATLGMGACRVIQTGGSLWMCSECGCEWRDKGSDGEPFMAVCGGAETPNFCPNCGRRIEQ